jgi:predicted phosphodiesterase
MMCRSMQRTIIVGDVHGCADELRLLLRKCGYSKGDRVVLAGDLVAKGPDSQGVVQFARENGVLAVLGNHDAFALAHQNEATRIARKTGAATSAAWVRTTGPTSSPCRLFLRLGEVRPGGPEVLVVHAGLVARHSLENQRKEHLRSLRSIADRRAHQPPAGPLSLGGQVAWSRVGDLRARRGSRLAAAAAGDGPRHGCVYGRQLTAIVLPEGKIVQVAALKRYAGR